jgi:pilus assembly protein CpaF
VSPVAARGACLVLKKPQAQMPALPDLVGANALSSGMADFLATCIAARRNLLVCGGPSSGKTSVTAALAAAAPVGERVVSVEEVAEMSIARDAWIQLEARPSNGRGGAEVDLATLLETALRLDPDRLVVGEVRGRDAMPLVSALCSSIDGAIVAVTGDGANAALSRVAMLARAHGLGNDVAIRELVAHAFEIVVHVVRLPDGAVRVASIEEVGGSGDSGFETTVLFQMKDGGGFAATGSVPRFYADLEARGIPADQAVFR